MQVDERQSNDPPADASPNATAEDWQTKFEQLRVANEVLQRQKADAEKDRELFRDMYNKASAHAGEVIRENNVLEERATIAEGQVHDGIAMVKSTYEVRIRRLEEEVKKWKGMYQLLVIKDQRTNSEEIRRRAALEGELELENAKLKEELELLREDYEKMEKVLEQLGEQELEQLGEQEQEHKQNVTHEQNLNAPEVMALS